MVGMGSLLDLVLWYGYCYLVCLSGMGEGLLPVVIWASADDGRGAAFGRRPHGGLPVRWPRGALLALGGAPVSASGDHSGITISWRFGKRLRAHNLSEHYMV